ncbi:hypothetical protein QC762_705260 [Podospora pseudocomata]|uniref:Uncharacterized protein n=1 Tax=Podospora pseudocomata TaxID=2093779 RepID=A0ABR0G391_9PEZI|nr:hypothetical protein QC762_705260 [Podospora pseudocomata]
MPCLLLSSMTRDRREAGIHWRCFPPLLHSILPVWGCQWDASGMLQLEHLLPEPTPGRTIRQRDQSVSNIAIAGRVAGWLGPILLLRHAQIGTYWSSAGPKKVERVASSKISSNKTGMFGRGGRDLLLMGRQSATEGVETREERLQQRACVFHVSLWPS